MPPMGIFCTTASISGVSCVSVNPAPFAAFCRVVCPAEARCDVGKLSPAVHSVLDAIDEALQPHGIVQHAEVDLGQVIGDRLVVFVGCNSGFQGIRIDLGADLVHEESMCEPTDEDLCVEHPLQRFLVTPTRHSREAGCLR